MWIQIDEKKVRHYWECSDCTNFAFVKPWFYSEMGEPTCEHCDKTMEYVSTEIDQ